MFEQWQDFNFKIKKEFDATMTKGLLWFGLDVLRDLAGITLFYLSSFSWLDEGVEHVEHLTSHNSGRCCL